MMMILMLVIGIDHDQAKILLQAGNDFYNNGDYDSSITSYRLAIEHDRNYVSAYSNLGNVLKDKGMYEESIAMHLMAIKLDPGNYKQYYNLGVSHHLAMDYENAIASYDQALMLNPDHINSNYNFGLTLQELGQLEDAISAYMTVLKLDPYHCNARLNYCNILMSSKSHFTERCYHDVITIDPMNVKGLINLASYYQSQVDFDMKKVKELYEKALAIEPSNFLASKALKALSGENADSNLDSNYVKELFDSYSYIFEDSLMNLKYNSHELIANFLTLYSKDMETHHLLDLGAGTGLACIPIREQLPNKDIIITGVDLSSKMLSLAEKKKCYNKTVTEDVVNYLEKDVSSYDIIVAADVVVYIGDLQKLLLFSRKRLSTINSLFVFTVENGDLNTDSSKIDEDYYVQLSGRYAHKKEYLIQIATTTGWLILDTHEFSGREDKGQPIPGYLLVLKPNDAFIDLK